MRFNNFKHVVILLLCASAAFANSCVLASTGNWRTATWNTCGGTYPQSGDTASIANGFTVTIPASETDTVGTSPSSDSASSGIFCPTTTGTGVLIVNGTLIYRGQVRPCTDTAVGPDAVLTHDSSLSSAATYTDIVIDGSDSTKATSAGAPFSTATTGLTFSITGGTGFTVQLVRVVSVSGAIATFSTSLGTVGSTGGTATRLTSYSWQQTNASVLRLNGTSGHRITIGKAAGSANTGQFWGGSNTATDSGNLVATYVNVSNCGVLNNNVNFSGWCFYTHQDTSSTFTLNHVSITTSAPIGWMPSATGVFTLDDVSITESLAAATSGNPQIGLSVGINGTNATAVKTSGTRRISGCYFHDAAIFWNVAPWTSAGGGYLIGMTFSNNWLSYISSDDGAVQILENGAGTPMFALGEWTGNIFFTTAPGAASIHSPGWKSPGGILSDTYVMADEYLSYPTGGPIVDTTQTNAHPVLSQAIPTAISGFIFEPYNGNTIGKTFLTSTSTTSGANFPMDIRNSIYLCGGGVNNIGWAWVDPYQTTNGTSTFGPVVTFHHNTACGTSRGFSGEPSGVAGENNSGTVWAGQYQGVFSNITYTASVAAGVIEGNVNSSYAAGAFAGLWDYNWRFNGTGTFYRHAGTAAYTTTPGTHDQSGDPQFADSTRNFLKWCQTINGADSTWLGCQAHFALRGTDSVDSRYAGADLITYVRAGFRPANSTVWTAGPQRETVGAVPVYSSILTGGVTASGGVTIH